MATGQVVPSEELVRRLDTYLAARVAAGDVVRLFRNNVTPAIGDTVASYTEANFSGYAAQALPSFSAAAFSTSKARATATSTLIFTNSTGVTGNTIYGYYVTNSAGTQLRWAHRPDNAPYDLSAAANAVNVLLKYTEGDDPSPD